MELRYYQTASGGRPFVEGLEDLTDITRAKDYFQDYKRRASEATRRRT